MASSAIATQDSAYSVPRLHVDVTINRTKATHNYRLVDDIALRNGPRRCLAGVDSC
jgi:hypothetical protein